MLVKKRPTSNSVTLSSMLDDSKDNALKIFVPVQRNYVWCINFVDRLCYEFCEVLRRCGTDDARESYLMPIAKSLYTNNLIDGQQRTTSCFILVRILAYIYEKKINELDKMVVDGSKFRELTNDALRYRVSGIENENDFFSRLFYYGNEEGLLMNQYYRESLSNNNLDLLFAGRLRNPNHYQEVALRFYSFVKDVEKFVGNVNWNDLMTRVSFTELVFEIDKDKEREFAENFAVMNSYVEPMKPYTIMKTLLGDDDFFKILYKEKDKYVYTNKDTTLSPEDVFVKHCMQAYLLIYGDEKNIATRGICFGEFGAFDASILFMCMTDDVVASGDGKKNLNNICWELRKFYYEIVMGNKIPYINLISEIGYQSTLMSSLFVLYHELYDTDREKFDMCMKYIYMRILLKKIAVGKNTEKQNGLDVSIRRFVYNVIRGLDVELIKVPTRESLSSVCGHIDNMEKNNTTKGKLLIRFLENEIRNIIGYNNAQNPFPTHEEYKNLDIDHFIAIGEERYKESDKNIVGNLFPLSKSDNRSKGATLSIDEILKIYNRSKYLMTLLFVLGRDAMIGAQYSRFEKLLSEVDENSEDNEESMINLFGDLILSPDSMILDYIVKRSKFLARLFAYLILKRYEEIKNFFGIDQEREVEFAEAELECVES